MSKRGPIVFRRHADGLDTRACRRGLDSSRTRFRLGPLAVRPFHGAYQVRPLEYGAAGGGYAAWAMGAGTTQAKYRNGLGQMMTLFFH